MKALVFNKQILLAVGMIAFAAAVIVQGTGAYFTDTETSAVNTFTAGTLELDINENGTGEAFTTNIGNVALNPGGETPEGQLRIKNGGSVNLGWFGYFNTGGNVALLDYVYIKEARMEFFNPDTSKWEPTDQFITNGDGSGPYPDFYQALAGPDDKITLNEWNSGNAMGVGNGVQVGALKPGGYEYRFTFKFGMVENVPNNLQGASLDMNYTLTSTQVSAEAIGALDAGDARMSVAAPADITTWMTAQLVKQGTVTLP